jgi:Tol biopolymer transport system component
MNRSLLFGTALLLVSSLLLGQTGILQESNIAHPVETPQGILFTNSTASSLYYYRDGATEELLSAPGCGLYFTLSPDGSTVGFKYISDDGLQAPALLDIESKKITLLHDPVPRAGQVSFSRNGAIAYSIGNDIVIRKNSAVSTISVGTYSNIAPLSADGSIVAYNDDGNQIFTYDLQSGQTEKITGGSAGYFFPQWSPSENVLCYSSLNGSLFTYSVATKKTSPLGEGLNPVWSGDGKSIIVERRVTEKQELINSDLFQISSDGTSVIQLTETKDIFESFPSAGTDGSIAFGAHNSNTLYTLTADHKTVNRAAIAETSLKAEHPAASTGLKKISSPAVYFEMPYTNQVYDTPNWYNGHSACGPTSSIMVIAYYGLLPAWNVWCSYSQPYHWSAYGNYVCEQYQFRGISYGLTASDPNGKPSWGGYGYMWSTGSPYSRMGAYYINHGLATTRQDAPTLTFVTDEVTGGHPYTLCNGLTTAGHIIVINGIGTEAHTLVANDPYGNKNSGSYPSRNGKGVSYDWPGYNNGNQNLNTVYWGITVRYTPPALGDSIVDDLQFTKGFAMSNQSPSSMNSWKDINTGYNGHMWYVKTKKSDTCYASWTPNISQEGMFEVSAYIPYSNATAARYIVRHSNGSDTVIVDQKQYKNSWMTIGTFPFTPLTVHDVRLGDGSDSTGQEIVFDAVQFKYLSPLQVGPMPRHIPDAIALYQNFPNPFNPATDIRFSIPFTLANRHASLRVYTVLGSEIAVLVDRPLSAGEYTSTFNAGSLASGVYLYRLQVGSTVLTKRMMVIK